MLMMSLADKSVAEVRFELTSAGVANPVHSLVELDWLPTVQSVSLSLINIRSFAQIIHQVWAGMKDKQQNRAKGMFARLTNQQHRERTILINFQSITLHIQVFRNNCETCKSFFFDAVQGRKLLHVSSWSNLNTVSWRKRRFFDVETIIWIDWASLVDWSP